MPRALCTHHMPSSNMLSLAFGVVGAQAEKIIPCTSDCREDAGDSQFHGYLLQALRQYNSQEHTDRLLHPFYPDISEMVMAIHLKTATANLMLEQPPGLLSIVTQVCRDHTMLTRFF